MRSIELFTGAGGLALGVHRAGFHHLLVVERDRHARATLRLNRERQALTGVDWPLAPEPGDVTTFAYASYQEIDLLAGGAPCQPFSLGGKHAGQADARNLFPEVVRAVRETRPRAFLLENVKGLTRANFRPYFDYILAQLRLPFSTRRPGEAWEAHLARLVAGQAQRPDHQYDVAWRVYNAADMGVPQARHRVFIVGFRHDLGIQWRFPEPTHAEAALLYAQYVDGSYWVEHGLPPRPAPPRLAGRVRALALQGPPPERRWRTTRDAIGDLPEPVDYQPWPGIDNHSGIPDARAYPGHTGSPWDWPAKTIKAGDHGNPGGENMLRQDDDSARYFTVRELARLQTFPDEWHFSGSWTESRRQLGNAVPVLLAEAIAHPVHGALARRVREADQTPSMAGVH